MLNKVMKIGITVLSVSSFLYAVGEYDYTKYNVEPSATPGGLSIEKVPMFVTIGFDDNMYSGDEVDKEGDVPKVVEGNEGMRWLKNFFITLKNPNGNGNAGTFDNAPARVSFYIHRF